MVKRFTHLIENRCQPKLLATNMRNFHVRACLTFAILCITNEDKSSQVKRNFLIKFIFVE